MTENPLWQYSVAVYQQPGVAELCLHLQDEFQADVNMLLCAAWLSSVGRALTPELLSQLSLDSQQWQQNCLQPLRQARRFLKPRAPADRYQAMKRWELEVEAMLQQKLYQRLQHLSLAEPDADLLANNLRAYMATLSASNDRQLVNLCEGLIQAIASSEE